MKQTLCPKRIKLPFLPSQHQFSTRKCRHRKELPCQQQRASHRVEIIINVVARHRLPAVYPNRFYPTDGGLLPYGPDYIDEYRRAAGYVDRILRARTRRFCPCRRRPNTSW